MATPTLVLPARPQRADALRNLETILDTGLAVLSANPDAGMAEIARACRLSRQTVYAHVESRERLLDALVARALDEAMTQVHAGQPEQGAAEVALRRVLATSWQAVCRHRGVIGTATKVLGAERMTAHHAPLRARLLTLLERGQAAGAFRTDVPAGWLLATYFALVHLAGDQLNAGVLDPATAESVLCTTVAGAFGVLPSAAVVSSSPGQTHPVEAR